MGKTSGDLFIGTAANLPEGNTTQQAPKNVMLYPSQDSKLVPFQYEAITLPVETTCAVQ
jgi:hypothetical protein